MSGTTVERHVLAVFPRDALSVGSARAWLAHFLANHGVRSSLSSDATLVLSELVTNALRHGLGDIVTRGSLADGEVHVSVGDAGADLPELQTVDGARIDGLGMHVVEGLADAWGVAAFPGGKTVWATLGRRGP